MKMIPTAEYGAQKLAHESIDSCDMHEQSLRMMRKIVPSIVVIQEYYVCWFQYYWYKQTENSVFFFLQFFIDFIAVSVTERGENKKRVRGARWFIHSFTAMCRSSVTPIPEAFFRNLTNRIEFV